MANQFRDYCLTINNPTQTDEEFLEYCKQLPHLKCLVFQREVGAEKSTEHFQIYLEFTLGKRFDTMKNYFPTAHIENRRSKDKKKARDYCKQESKPDKDGLQFSTRISGPHEWGEFVEIGERSDLSDIIALVQDGATDSEIRDLYPSQYFRYFKNIGHIRQQHLEEKYKNTFRVLETTYIFGSAGVGKTRFVMVRPDRVLLRVD